MAYKKIIDKKLEEHPPGVKMLIKRENEKKLKGNIREEMLEEE